MTRTRIELPVSTILKVLATLGLLWLLFQAWQILFLALLGALIAMVLDHPTARLHERGLPRGVAVAVVVAVVVAVAALLFAWLAPRLAEQAAAFWQQLPDYVERGLAWLRDRQPWLYDQILTWADDLQQGRGADLFDVRGLLDQGVGVINGIVNVVIVLVFAVYFLADRGRSLQGILRILPPAQADKARRSTEAVADTVRGYVVGQSINSTLFGLFSLAVLSLLDVPTAGVLALVAAVGDAIPQIGVALATIPTAIVAYTVSPQTALIVVLAYGAYQVVENYVTSPRVFRETLDLPPLITLIAVMIGGKLLGVVGVLLALPTAAVIPALWRIWVGEDDGAPAEP